MITKTTLFLLLFMNTVILHAQNNKLVELKGRVVADFNDLQNINIINETKNKYQITEEGGFFKVACEVGDTLVFSSISLKSVTLVVKETDIQKEFIIVRMEPLMRQLDEVVIKKSAFDAVSLGILTKPAKTYTPAERKLYTANSGGGFDGLLNTISGRNKMLKKEAIIEKKELAFERMENLVDDKYILETLKIPTDYLNGFKFYVVEDNEFVASLKARNKVRATFLLNELATKYLALIGEK